LGYRTGADTLINVWTVRTSELSAKVVQLDTVLYQFHCRIL
jgi:hypothetical protein